MKVWVLYLATFAVSLTLLADDEETLGSLLYSDPNLSLNRNQSCATCHSLKPAVDPVSGQPFPVPGFVDPVNVQDSTPVSRGSVSGAFGQLNAPSTGYAAFSPVFHWDAGQGNYLGGQFWNGRAATLEAQAAQPLLNPVEMAMPSPWAVVTRLKENATYRQLFSQLYGLTIDAIPDVNSAAPTNPAPAAVQFALDALTQAISQFERSSAFAKFTSKFDFWLAGVTSLSSNELNGYNLFIQKGSCSACHISDSGTDAHGKPTPPLFTDFSYHNIGLPKNDKIPGSPAPDLGLGGRADIAGTPAGSAQLGKHKVMSLRNIALTPPYGHNGVFTSLEQVVHFYNTRDVLGQVDSNTNAVFGIAGWPPPEVPQNVDRSLVGFLRLTAQEEADLVAFLKTLTDGYPDFGGDPRVPAGSGTPFPNFAVPAIPVYLSEAGPGKLLLSGRLGKSYQVEFADSLIGTNAWQPLLVTRLLTNSQSVVDTNLPRGQTRFYRAWQFP